MADVITRLADAIAAPQSEPAVSLRIGMITSVEVAGSRRVQTDQTGEAWLNRDANSSFTPGDRVWILQQHGVWLVAGRLEGGDATPIGAVQNFAGSAAPPGWLMCDGTAVSRTTYAALFAVIGTTYGTGNGSTTFTLPNLLNRVPVGSGSTYTRGGTGGASTVTLTTAQIPAHTHGSDGDHYHTVNNSAGGTGVDSGTTKNVATLTPGNTTTDGAHTHASVGSGSSHENMPPYLAMPYIIRAN